MQAINRLGRHEKWAYELYSGLNGIRFSDYNPFHTFATFLSSSKSKDVALNFRGENGVLLTFNKSLRSTNLLGSMSTGVSCDVSWISKFPDEMEIL